MYKVAFVLGGANTLDDDLEIAYSFCQPDTIIACNNAGRDWPHELPHYATLHTEKMPGWLAERKQKGYPDPKHLWTSNVKTIPKELEPVFRRVPSWDGSSGLLCITVALSLGYHRIILCGVPLDKFANHYDDTQEWMDAPRYRHAWVKNLSKMQGKVKSPSGWTKQILGEPTKEWTAQYDTVIQQKNR